MLKGIGSSSDGRNGSLTAPVPAGQLSALERAYADAAVSPGSVSLIEAHSTGTSVGDRVECEALNHLLRESGSKPQSCALGSVKSMIGHTKTAAGLAGLIKSSLALKHHVLPPTIGVNQPNKVLCDPASALYVNTENRPWLVSNGHAPRRAGVSSFGFGGTNFHAVLEEYTEEFHDSDRIDLNPRPSEIFTWRRDSRRNWRGIAAVPIQRLQVTRKLRIGTAAMPRQFRRARSLRHVKISQGAGFRSNYRSYPETPRCIPPARHENWCLRNQTN